MSLAGKSPLLDVAVVAVLHQLFQAELGVTLMPALLEAAAYSDGIKGMFGAIFDNNVTAHVILTLNHGKDDWCGIVVHVKRQEILYYDGMASHSILVAGKVVLELPRLDAKYYGSNFGVHAYEASRDI